MGLFDAPDLGPATATLNNNSKRTRKQGRAALGDITSYAEKGAVPLNQSAENFAGIQGQQQAGYDMYQNSLGLNGPGGYQAALGAFQQGPGYQFALDQANQNVLRNSAATGGVASGNTLMALSDRAQQLQNLEFGNWQNRLQGFDPMRGATGQAAALADLSNLWQGTGTNLANSRQGFAGLNSQNANSLANLQMQQAQMQQQADMMPWQLALGGLNAASGFYGA